MQERRDIVIERVEAATHEVVRLLDELNWALSGPYSEEQRHALPIHRLFEPHIRFFVVRMGSEAVACGGVGFYDGYAELKRMYSKPAVRGRGMAKALLGRLETEARRAGVKRLRLETGMYQREALRFYERAGFKRRGSFGPYKEMAPEAIETSVFYEKAL